MCGNSAAAANGADPFSATAVTAIPAGGGSGATPARGAASSGFDGCHTLRVSGSKEGDASSVDGAYYFAAMHAASGFPWFCRGAVNCGDGNSGGMSSTSRRRQVARQLGHQLRVLVVLGGGRREQ